MCVCAALRFVCCLLFAAAQKEHMCTQLPLPLSAPLLTTTDPATQKASTLTRAVNDMNGRCSGSSCPGTGTAFCSSLASRRSTGAPAALRRTLSMSDASTANAMRLWWRLCATNVPGSKSVSCVAFCVVHCVQCVGVCGQRATHTHAQTAHTIALARAHIGEGANTKARSSSRRTVLMRAQTCAPSVCSAVCTRQNCSGVISSEHERPNFSTVGRNARSSVIAPRCVKTPLNFILFACCRCCLSRLLLRGGGYCRGRLECGGGGLTPLAPAHYKFTACAARRAPPRTPPTAWGKTGARRRAALLAGQRRENAPRSDAQPREALPCTNDELMTADDE